jgi:Pol polyprotein, beta-barrel domain/GAG-pre-integrase domain/Integrase core domain
MVTHANLYTKGRLSSPSGEEQAATTMVPGAISYHLDSAATSSCSPYQEDFLELTPIEAQAIKGVNGSSIAAIGIGRIKIMLKKGQDIMLRDVLYAPQAALCLISVGRLADDNMTVLFRKGKCTVWNADNKIVAKVIRRERGLYTLVANHPQRDYSCLAHTTPTVATWHKHLGHVSYQSIIDMAKHNMAKGMPVDLSLTPSTCEYCILGKQAKTPVPRTREGERAKAPLEIIYTNLTGPEDVPSAGGALYLMNILDDYSSYPWGFTIKKKYDATKIFKDWRVRVERETGQKIWIIRTDGGGEFSGAKYVSALQEAGIEHQTTAPYTSAQNGRFECLHCTIMGRAQAMRLDAKLPPNLWGECAIAAFYLAQ